MIGLKKIEFFFAVLIIIIASYFLVATYLDWYDFSFLVGFYRFNHWLVWASSIYIALAVPSYAILKRRYPFRAKQLLSFHVFGNLLAFILISIHFASQVGRPVAFYPDLGTGIALYLSILLLTATGISQRFGILKKIKNKRFVHVSFALTFYLIIGIHVLQGLSFL